MEGAFIWGRGRECKEASNERGAWWDKRGWVGGGTVDCKERAEMGQSSETGERKNLQEQAGCTYQK